MLTALRALFARWQRDDEPAPIDAPCDAQAIDASASEIRVIPAGQIVTVRLHRGHWIVFLGGDEGAR